jgi:hypothetical protein
MDTSPPTGQIAVIPRDQLQVTDTHAPSALAMNEHASKLAHCTQDVGTQRPGDSP